MRFGSTIAKALIQDCFAVTTMQTEQAGGRAVFAMMENDRGMMTHMVRFGHYLNTNISSNIGDMVSGKKCRAKCLSL